jgi:Flp pilus assembly protein TadG
MTPKRSWKTAILSPFKRGRTFGCDERGTTAIEFALLGIPFFALIGAILETAFVFLSGQVMDSAVQDASRLIRTGQANNANFNAASFKTALCSGLYGLFDCNQIKLRTSTVVKFVDAVFSSPIDPVTGEWKPEWITDSYNGGGGSAVIMVEAYYKWPTIVNLGGFNLANTPDGKRLVSAVRVFRNEPF